MSDDYQSQQKQFLDMVESHRRQDEKFRGSGMSGSDWHTEKLCELHGFSEEECRLLKCEINRVIQNLFGGTPEENHPSQFLCKRITSRAGDPAGSMGWIFCAVRRVYYAMEYVPILNNLYFWSLFDSLVLTNNDNPVVVRYLASLSKEAVVKTT
jgi:hypothetical protein